jgi:hypothetical protein
LRVRYLGVRSRVLVAVAAFVALVAGGTVLALSVGAAAAPFGLQQVTDPEPVPTDPEPTPDPAPTPAPAPKPKPKPAPKPAPTPSTRVTPEPEPTYSPRTSSPAPTVRKAVPKKRPAAKKPKRLVKKAVATPVERPRGSTTDAIILDQVLVGAKRAPLSTSGDTALTQVLFIAGVTFASLLFLLAAAVPSTAVRFTPVGRVVLEHQQDFVLVGIASLVITVFVYVLTGHGV